MLDIAEKHINRLCCRHTQNMSSPCDFQAPKWNRSTLSIRLALTNTTFHFDTRASECTISKRWARWLHLIRAAICECMCVRLYVFLRVYSLHEVKRHAKVARVEHMKEIFLDIMAINRNWRFRFIAHYSLTRAIKITKFLVVIQSISAWNVNEWRKTDKKPNEHTNSHAFKLVFHFISRMEFTPGYPLVKW